MRRKRIKIFYRPWIGIRIEPEKCPMLEQPECPMLEHLCFIFEPPDHVFKNYSTKQSPFLTYFRKKRQIHNFLSKRQSYRDSGLKNGFQ